MALFSKEPENNLKPSEAMTPAAPGPQPVGTAVLEERWATASPHTVSVAAQPGLPADGLAYLDKVSKVTGKLFFDGPVRIDGQVDGEISANDSVVIGEGAIVTAQLKAASVVIAGKISGDILASKRVEIRPTGKVFSNLTTPILVVHDGAQFEGNCAMHAETGPDNRKVTPIAKDERIIAQVAVEGGRS